MQYFKDVSVAEVATQFELLGFLWSSDFETFWSMQEHDRGDEKIISPGGLKLRKLLLSCDWKFINLIQQLVMERQIVVSQESNFY